MVGDKIINLFGDVDDHGNHRQDHDGVKERSQEFL
jgi:hypothetical protein